MKDELEKLLVCDKQEMAFLLHKILTKQQEQIEKALRFKKKANRIMKKHKKGL